MKIRNICVN